MGYSVRLPSPLTPFACSCSSRCSSMEAARQTHTHVPKYPHVPVGDPISYLSHKLHLHLTPIAPYQISRWCVGSPAHHVSVCPSPYVIGQHRLQGIIILAGYRDRIFVLMLPGCGVLTFARSICESAMHPRSRVPNLSPPPSEPGSLIASSLIRMKQKMCAQNS